jgi:predicted metal-dependent phosphoesterase TrpH
MVETAEIPFGSSPTSPTSPFSSSPNTALADLHVHSTFSDGADNFTELARQAAKLNITHLAFTDHDTLAGSERGREAAAQHGVVGLAGIEISGWDPIGGRKAHILGYGFVNGNAPIIEQLCAPIRAARHENSLAQIEKLERAGYTLSRSHINRLARDSGCIFKQHIMAALTAAPFTSDEYQALYRRLFKGQGICAHDTVDYPDAREAVEAIRQSGGIAVLAHPGEFDNYSFVSYLVDVGLAGIEKYHPRHSRRDWEKVDQLTCAYGLFCTGGSDYHGAFGAPATPGAQHITLPPNDPFLTRITL